MTLFSTTSTVARGPRRRRRSHLIPIVLGARSAQARSRWWRICCGRPGAGCVERSVTAAGKRRGTLFNVPPMAVRMKIQRHSGPQERVDLYFAYPSLEARRRAKTRQRRYGGRSDAADRPDIPVDRGAS